MLIVVHLAATWFMVGLIWVIQTVHYPLFSAVGSREFAGYERRHTASMGRLLAIPAITEVVTAALVVVVRPDGIQLWAAWTAGALLGAVWIITALVQVPLHGRLSDEHDPATIRRLVRSNWIRTALWTGRGVLAAGFLA
jgi:hypothetical protein